AGAAVQDRLVCAHHGLGRGPARLGLRTREGDACVESGGALRAEPQGPRGAAVPHPAPGALVAAPAWRGKIAGLGLPLHGNRRVPRVGRSVMKSILRAGVGLIAMGAMNSMVLAQDMPTKVGPGEGALNIIAWVGYIERGDSD